MKKKLAAGVVAVGVLAGTGTAVAYWSTTGAGTGSATASSGASNLTVSQASAPSDLAPGVASEAVTGTITNNAPNTAYVNSLTVKITGVDAAHSAGCSAADFGLTTTSAVLAKSSAVQSVTLNVKTELAANNGSVAFPVFQIGFANDSANAQDGCKGAVPQLSYSTN